VQHPPTGQHVDDDRGRFVNFKQQRLSISLGSDGRSAGALAQLL
jgi:hypothetical protein